MLQPQSETINDLDVAVSREEDDQALFTAALSNAPACAMRLPWEQGVFGIICGKANDACLPDPLNVPLFPAEFPVSSTSSVAVGSAVAQKAQRQLGLPVHSAVVKALRDEDAFEQLDRLWHVAVAKRCTIFVALGYPGSVGSAILTSGADERQSGIVLRDTLGIRSPRTAIKRALTVQRFLNWMKATREDFMDLNRAHVLQYLANDGEVQPAATSGTALFEAFRFCRYVMDIPIPDEVLRDPQILGRVQRW